MKNYVTIVIALISLLGTIVVAMLQTGKAEESTVQVIVDQINDRVIPRLQDDSIRIGEEIAKLRERVAALEALKDPKKAMFDSSRIRLEQFSKRPFPKLVMKQESELP